MSSLSVQNSVYKAYVLNQLMSLFVQCEITICTRKSDSCRNRNILSKMFN